LAAAVAAASVAVAAAQLRDVGGSLAAARAMAMATKRVMVNTTIKFKWWHGREAEYDDDDTCRRR
jgi:hypothetical protein